MLRTTLALFTTLSLTALCQSADVKPDAYLVGVAEVDITPKDPIRMNGFGSRRDEHVGVNHPVYARAISIRHADDSEPLVLMTVDVLGITADHRAELVKRLKGSVSSERLAITATHTHCGPMVSGANPTLFGVPIPDDHLTHIDAYTRTYLDNLEQAALTALKDPKPAYLYWGVGTVGFAKNRRPQPNGPTDHDLPVLLVRDAKTAEVKAVYTGYACHCTSLTHNKISGDWAGYAAAGIGKLFPGAVGLVSIGCGADQNPDAREPTDKDEAAVVRGRMIADEVKRLAGGFLAPVGGKPSCVLKSISLPLADHPDRKGWEKLAEQKNAIGHHARVQLAKLDKGENLITAIDYPIQTWAFGESLAMVHLPGEVVVDYGLRLKAELDRSRVWVTGYANNNPCYIPSERILKEGGYEGGGAMVYYDVPTVFKQGLEESIVKEVKAQLPKFASPTDAVKLNGTKPLSPQQSLAALRVGPKMAVDLVAAEPLVSDPVAIAFGPDGKLWVAEMLDYPSGKTGKFEPGGRVRFLEDTNGDGTFDTSTTFLDGLPFPTGVLPYRTGVLVCAAPDILYAEDTDGDSKADKITKLFSGFGTGNYQARVNGLAYGLDGWIYGSCGLFGGEIVSSKTGKKFSLGDRDFRIKPDTGEIEPAVGRTQQGRVRNDWGDWFGCDNSNLAWHYPLPDQMVKRNPFVAPPNTVVNLAPENTVFPARAPQLFNLSGVSGRTTAACGIGVYRDAKLGAEFTGNVFTCEPVNLVVTRRVLKAKGGTYIAERAASETDKEFLAGTDPWFRPVMATTGPDGGLWVADMYRFVIEHPRWIPPAELAKVDPRAGAGLGRIYRVRPEGDRPKAWPRLDKMTTAELVAALDSPNGWQRDMATEMLAWKADKAAVPLLVKSLDAKRPETKLHALVTLDRLGGLEKQHLWNALKDAHPGVKRHAVRLAERFINDHPAVANAVAKLADDPDPMVRQQVAFTVGTWADSRAGGVLSKVAVKDKGDPYLVAAVLSSLNKDTFAGFVASPAALDPALLPKLISTAVGLGDDKALSVLLKTVTAASGGKYEAWQFTVAESVLDAWQRAAKGKEPPADVVAMFASARTVAVDAKGGDDVRAAAVRLLGREKTKAADDIATLSTLLAPKTPTPVQFAAVAALTRTADDKAADALIKGWSGYSPAVQSQVVSALLGRPTWVPKVLENLGGGSLPPSAVSPGTRQALLTSPDAKVRALAEKAFTGAVNADRAKVIATYTQQLPKAGDVAKGKVVFGKTCAACHKLDGVGHAVGPDLAALANKSAEYLLAEVLDPNRNLDNRYLEYIIHTTDGRTLNGLLANETAAGVTLRQADGKEVSVLRADFDGFKTSGKSLMPEGLEKDVSPAAMADLIAYLTSREAPAKRLPGNTPAVVKPTDSRLSLPASAAEIRGDEITFETDFGNIGFWHGAKDHAAWRVVLPAAAEFDVYIDFACDGTSAGNPIAFDGGEPVIRSKVIGTGGWANYRLMRLGTFKLPAGESKLVMRPDADTIRGALIDLRTVLLVPKGQKPETVEVKPKATGPATDKPEDIARYLLDETKPAADRQAAVTQHLDKAAAILKAMAATLPPDKEGYTTGWMWRVAIASGKRNNADDLRAILDVSLPKKGEKLRDWQAVVVGGGVVNGISMEHGWPSPRVVELIGKDVALTERWTATLEAAVKLADDTATRNAVRYDALRLIPLRGWKASGDQLTKYLAKGTDAELQMGAVSGLVDVDAPEASAALVGALTHLSGTNRELALKGLLRTDDRSNALLDAVEKGSVKADTLGDATTKALRESKSATVKARAAKVLK